VWMGGWVVGFRRGVGRMLAHEPKLMTANVCVCEPCSLIEHNI